VEPEECVSVTREISWEVTKTQKIVTKVAGVRGHLVRHDIITEADSQLP
jgi:hypothetical protein